MASGRDPAYRIREEGKEGELSMTVHISRVEIKNFRNFGHLVLDPFPARAVIVGENGVGKSNLLHALRLVLDPSLPDSARQLRAEDVWEGGAKSLAQGVVVTVAIELSGFDDDDDAKAVLSKCTVGFDPYVARMTYRFVPRSEVAVVNEAGDVFIEGLDRPLTSADYLYATYGGDDEGNDATRVRRDVALRVLHALRDAESDLQNWRRNPLRDLLERLPLDAANLESTALNIAAAVDQLRLDPNVSTLEGHLMARLNSMTGPRRPLQPSLGFASTAPDELVRAVRLFIDAGRRHQVADASLGGANVLYLGLLLESLTQQRLQDEFVTTILAVEEPEAHLHVSLQRRLFSYLLRSEPTLLLTTHSPHIAAVTPLHSLVVLRNSNSGTVGHTTAGLAVSDRQKTDLERYLDVSRAEILFASSVILVEGLAELYVIPALANAAGFDLDSHGVIVASVHGTDFAPFVRLLGDAGLDTPWVVVTDGDPDGRSPARREAGLRRALRLLSAGPEREALEANINALAGSDSTATDGSRSDLVAQFASAGIFVGDQTLEVDLSTLFEKQFVGAFNELPTSAGARSDVRDGLENEEQEVPDPEVRSAMLGRIETLGKGRFAQRLAAHIETLDLGTFLGDQGIEIDGDLLDVGSAAYVLRALDHVSHLVRGVPLLDEQPGSEE